MKAQLVIIEDDASIRESVSLFVQAKSQIPVLGEWESVEDFLNHDYASEAPTIMCLDVGLPGMSGIEGIPHILKKYPDLSIIMLTTYEEDDVIFAALCAGACSYISKRTSLQKIVEALNIVCNGGSYMSPSIARKVASFFRKQKEEKKKTPLSPRQKEIVEHIVKGRTYNEIASLCYISLNTVRSHIKRIYEILQINSKISLVQKYHDGEV